MTVRIKSKPTTKRKLGLPGKLAVPLDSRPVIDNLCDLTTAAFHLNITDRRLTVMIKSGQMPSIVHEDRIKIRSIVLDNYIYNPIYRYFREKTEPIANKDLCA